jgi:hypothetical protein
MLTYVSCDVCYICRCCAKRRRGRRLRRTRRYAASVWQAGRPSPAYQVPHFTCFPSLTRTAALTEQKEELDGELAALCRIIAALNEKMDTWRLRHEILATQRDRGEATIRHLWHCSHPPPLQPRTPPPRLRGGLREVQAAARPAPRRRRCSIYSLYWC